MSDERNNRGWALWTAVICCAATFGCERSTPDKKIGTAFENLPPIITGIENASRLVVFRGLPDVSSTAFREELRSKKTMQVHGFHFYAEALEVNHDDSQRLREWACADNSFERFLPMDCGGFHPDFCLIWKHADNTFYILACFSCGQVQCFGPKHEVFCNIQSEALQHVHRILMSYL